MTPKNFSRNQNLKRMLHWYLVVIDKLKFWELLWELF